MQHQRSRQAIIAAVETATQAEPGSLAESAKLRGLNGWDSLGIVSFIEEVLKNFGVELPVDDVLDCATIHDLVELVSQR